MLCCHQAQGRGQMGLAHTGRAEKDYILPIDEIGYIPKIVNTLFEQENA